MKKFCIVLMCIIMVGISTPSFSYESQAAPRPGTNTYSTSDRPCIGFGPECEDNRPDVLKPRPSYDTSKYIIPTRSDYERKAASYSYGLSDWYLRGGMNANNVYPSRQSMRNIRNDMRVHKNYYKKCISYGIFRSMGMIYNYYQKFSGDQLSRTLAYHIDGIAAGCYNNR